MTIKTLIKTAAVVALLAVGTHSASANGCGWYALGGAFQNLNLAYNHAGDLDASVYDLDQSNSPNAGKGYYAVALKGGSKWRAREYRNEFRRNGVRSAYIKNMCFYGPRL